MVLIKAMSKALPMLYNTSASGEERYWMIEVVQTQGGRIGYASTYGQSGGTRTESEFTEVHGKNVGKANETNDWEQALLEARSKWNKKKDSGYSETRGGIIIPNKPMLAKVFEDHEHKLVYPVYVQPKLDGQRMIAWYESGQVVMMSRRNKEIKYLDHIRRSLESFFRKWPYVVLDGELYNHELHADFGSLMSFIKKDQIASRMVEYHVYDIIEENRPSTNRQADLTLLGLDAYNGLHRVHTFVCGSKEKILMAHDDCVFDGYEGAIVRVGTGKYVNRRSDQLLKLKTSEDAEFEVVGYEEGTGKFKGQPILVCKTKDGGTFTTNLKGTLEERRAFYRMRNEFIGKMATVKFTGWTSTAIPKPRFPREARIRQD